MSKEDLVECEGKVVEVLPGLKFKVELTNGFVVNAYLSGKLRQNYIRVIEGDVVKVELSPYDLNNGRIVYRNKA